MSKISVVNFNSGEVSPEIDARPDIEKYIGGCRKLENMIPDIYGNATRRPGTELITVGNGAACYWVRPAIDPTKIGISTAEELQKISYDPEYPVRGDYELRADIDCSGIENFLPIGGRHTDLGGENVFEGTFDGRYHTISNVTTESTDVLYYNATGLFGEVKNATIQRLIVTGSSITQGSNVSQTIGLLCGRVQDTQGAFTDCYVQGTITTANNKSFTRVGGCFGEIAIDSSVTRCGVDVTISEVGTNRIIYGGGFAGGISGDSTITDCYAIGTISGTLQRVGGFTGETLWDASAKQVDYTNCYIAMVFSGAAHTTYQIGGYAGGYDAGSDQDREFTSCFWDGTIIDELSNKSAFYDWGKLPSTDAEGNVAGVTESTTSAMQKRATYSGWDFVDVWQINEGNDYPRHQWHQKVEVCYPL